MRKVDLCRVSLSGKVYHLVAVFREGSKVASHFCIMLGRRRLEPCNYPTIDYALKVFEGVIAGHVVRLLVEEKS